MLIFSVSALSMDMFTAILLDMLVKVVDEGAGVEVVVVSVLLLHVELLELVLGNQLVSLLLGSLEGGEGSVSGVLAFHVIFYLSLSSLSVYLHTDLLRIQRGSPRCT